MIIQKTKLPELRMSIIERFIQSIKLSLIATAFIASCFLTSIVHEVSAQSSPEVNSAGAANSTVTNVAETEKTVAQGHEQSRQSDKKDNKFNYRIDLEHSSVNFKVRHMGLSSVVGQFRDFYGTFFYDPSDPTTAKTDLAIRVSSLDTGSAKRDKHLRSADFLNFKDFTKIYFISNKVEKVGENKLRVKGVLTIRDIQREVYLDVTYLGTLTDPWGTQRAGFEGKTTINRKDFNLVWNRILESGALLVGEEVEIYFNLQGLLIKDGTPKMLDPSSSKKIPAD